MSCDISKFERNGRSACLALESGEGCRPASMADCLRIQSLCGRESMDCSDFVNARVGSSGTCDMNKFLSNGRAACLALESGEGCMPSNLSDCLKIQSLCGPESMNCSDFSRARAASTSSTDDGLTSFNKIQIGLASALILLVLFILIVLMRK